MPDKKGSTAWAHLIAFRDATILSRVCEILKSHDLSLDQLHIDAHASSMLYYAYRAYCEERILIKFGSNPNYANKKGCKAHKRTHTLHTACAAQKAKPKSSVRYHEKHQHSSEVKTTSPVVEQPWEMQIKAVSDMFEQLQGPPAHVTDTPQHEQPQSAFTETSSPELEVSDCA